MHLYFCFLIISFILGPYFIPIHCSNVSLSTYNGLVFLNKDVVEISKDIDLKGDILEFPSGTVLLFRGGKINNGILKGHNIIIDAPPYEIFGKQLLLKGKFSSSTTYLEWFGAKRDGITDSSKAMRLAISFGGEIKLLSGAYLFKSPIVLNNSVRIIGNGSHSLYDNTRLLFSVSNGKSAIINDSAHTFNTGQNTYVEDVIIEPISWDEHSGPGIDLTRPIHMRNVVVQKFKEPNMIIHHDDTREGPYNSVFISCHFQLSGNHGVVVGRGGNSITFISCMFIANGTKSCGVAFPTELGEFDGLFVSGRANNTFDQGTINTYGYNANSKYPKYTVENLTIIGGTSSHNSRYGWNFSDVCNSMINAGYSEANLSKKQVFIGNYVSKCTFIFNNIKIDDIVRRGDYHKRQNNLITQGRIFSTASNDCSYKGFSLSKYDNHIEGPYNSEILLFETEEGRISLNADYLHNCLSLNISEGAKFRLVNSGETYNLLGSSYKKVGLFVERPMSKDLPIGFEYFCIDKAAINSEMNGIVIYYVGNETWVDALGRKVN